MGRYNYHIAHVSCEGSSQPAPLSKDKGIAAITHVALGR